MWSGWGHSDPHTPSSINGGGLKKKENLSKCHEIQGTSHLSHENGRLNAWKQHCALRAADSTFRSWGPSGRINEEFHLSLTVNERMMQWKISVGNFRQCCKILFWPNDVEVSMWTQKYGGLGTNISRKENKAKQNKTKTTSFYEESVVLFS